MDSRRSGELAHIVGALGILADGYGPAARRARHARLRLEPLLMGVAPLADVADETELAARLDALWRAMVEDGDRASAQVVNMALADLTEAVS